MKKEKIPSNFHNRIGNFNKELNKFKVRKKQFQLKY